MKRPRPLPPPGRPLDQAHPLVAAQSARASDRQPARDALGSPAGQPPALPRLPAARRAAAALPPRRPRARARPSRCLDDVGVTVAPEAVRPPCAHAARTPKGDPRRHPTRPLQRSPRRPQQQDPPDQPPRLRLPLRRPPDRARLPLLRRHHDRPPAMNFTHNSTGAPQMNDPAREPARLRPETKRIWPLASGRLVIVTMAVLGVVGAFIL